jgi:hypothetical protein
VFLAPAPLRVARPIQRVVMQDHRHAVLADAVVQFHQVGTSLECEAEGRQRVLGRDLRIAAVANDQGPFELDNRQCGFVRINTRHRSMGRGS